VGVDCCRRGVRPIFLSVNLRCSVDLTGNVGEGGETRGIGGG
jgi:hypothetical protein